ncbi:MAG TPA: ABC transporter substrate-binding protein [Thermoleophilaceae bacterium]|nr:ABC transporter substrate-binding protein [Thermoleophilaceae bacterium]
MRKRIQSRAAIGLLLAASLTTAACGSSDKKTATAATTGDASLTVVSLAPPTSLNPALNSICASCLWFTSLAYDSLIHTGPKGKLEPGLASSWEYVGQGNTHFRLHIRSGAKFADGTPVDAEAVAKSIEYTRKAGGQTAVFLGTIKSVKASDASTVDIELSQPNPELPTLFSSQVQLGMVISPKALAKPAALGNRTAGAGPYMLSPSQTVSNDHYTYVPNPNYWNKTAVHYKTITIKVVKNTTAALQVLRTGAADLALGDLNTAPSARSARLKVYSALVAQTGIDLIDRKGDVSKPLADVRVRQALNYAVDRKTIAESILHGEGQPVNQVGTPGTPGYLESASDQYSYNPQKAKQLLAEAGYPNGFKVNMEIFTQNPPTSDVAQAVISDWEKIGVKVDANSDSDGAAYAKNVGSKKYATFSYGFGYTPFYLYSQTFYLPIPNPFNAFVSNDSQLVSLITKGNAATGEERTKLYEQATQRALDLAWLVPVTSYPVLYFATSKVGNVQVDPARPLLDLTELVPAAS